MRFKKLISAFLAAAFCVSLAGMAFAEKLTKVPTAWMDEHETFLIWYAKEKGWDKEAGLDIDIQYFGSGMDILNALPSGSEVLGSPDTVKGKTFLTTTVSSAHYGLSSWLKVLGLTDKDITIKNMDQAQALAAFDNGIGDGVALWAPHMYAGQEKGWKIAGDLHMCKVGNPIVLIADTAYAEKNPEITAKFLSIYLRAVNMLQKEPLESLVPEYQRFFLEWAGKNYSPELSLTDLKTHPVYNLEEQLALFDTSKGMSTAQKWQSDIAKFFASVGSINKDELKKVENGAYATDKYLKLVKTPIPSYK